MRRCRVRVRAAKKSVTFLRRAARAAVKTERLGYPCAVDVFLLSDQELRSVNRERRGQDAFTDVLSFPAWSPGEEPVPDPDTGRVFLGDILIAYGRVLTQARRFGHSAEREISYLAAHGALHLLGYDHGTEQDKLLMRQREDAVMERLGLER